MNEALTVVAVVAIQAAIIAACLVFERRQSAPSASRGSAGHNLAYLVPAGVLNAVLAPLGAGVTTLAVNAAGGGLIQLPTAGPPMLLGALCYALAMDGGEYLFHRAQHRFPILWAMHSLHHSDASVNASTAPRHFWAEPTIKAFTVYILVGMLFKANVLVVGIYSVLGLYNYFLHMNVRVGFGKRAAWLNSPQFHRIHHSRLPEHHGCNYAALFPVFDVVFGTFRPARPDEYPPTGLDTGDAPRSLVEMVIWPWRRRPMATADHPRGELVGH